MEEYSRLMCCYDAHFSGRDVYSTFMLAFVVVCYQCLNRVRFLSVCVPACVYESVNVNVSVSVTWDV